jgi:tRNA G18 (ribose-2'-O)-methylase SpoU
MSYNVHDSLKQCSVEELKSTSELDRLNYAICLMNVEYDNNIGNSIRSAHIFGAKKVVIFGKKKVDTRGTVGAHNYIQYIKHVIDDFSDENCVLAEFRKMCLEHNLYPFFIEKTSTSKKLSEIRKKICLLSHQQNTEFKNIIPCLVFGNENKGIPEFLMQKTSNEIYHIPQLGVIRSLNVASAVAVATYEISKYITFTD